VEQPDTDHLNQENGEGTRKTLLKDEKVVFKNLTSRARRKKNMIPTRTGEGKLVKGGSGPHAG